jgi:hypothetical protein
MRPGHRPGVCSRAPHETVCTRRVHQTCAHRVAYPSPARSTYTPTHYTPPLLYTPPDPHNQPPGSRPRHGPRRPCAARRAAVAAARARVAGWPAVLEVAAHCRPHLDSDAVPGQASAASLTCARLAGPAAAVGRWGSPPAAPPRLPLPGRRNPGPDPRHGY